MMMMQRITSRTLSRVVRNRPIKMQRSNINGGTEGATAHAKGWGEKEKAQENMWARQAEKEKIKLLKQVLQEQKKATDAIKKELDVLSKRHE
ncbi:hypothetical protein BDA99DRAFT_564717 [Phascolomyces articulosus]|uniref:ATPase inhibitor, mitochondrial n=1 Tax=Phascolomyces articulosus TaxID=60185 RepID=A0AAD5PAI6_9FUNG|nr:hypothetical protein BDA99DRAFT_564717 [Phascolomyces articulosus]